MGQYNEGNFGVTYPTGISLFVTNDLSTGNMRQSSGCFIVSFVPIIFLSHRERCLHPAVADIVLVMNNIPHNTAGSWN